MVKYLFEPLHYIKLTGVSFSKSVKQSLYKCREHAAKDTAYKYENIIPAVK